MVSGPFIPHEHTGPGRVDAINVCGMNERGLPTSPQSPLPMSSPTGRGEFPPGGPAVPSPAGTRCAPLSPWQQPPFRPAPGLHSLSAQSSGGPGCPSQMQLDDDSSGLRTFPQLSFASAGRGLRFLHISPPRSHVLPVGCHRAGELPTHLLPSSQRLSLRLIWS